MENLEQFKKDFKQHLEDEWNASAETLPNRKLIDVENSIHNYIKQYFDGIKVKSAELQAINQQIYDQFTESKIKVIK